MHIHGTRIEMEVEIYATNQGHEYQCIALNWKRNDIGHQSLQEPTHTGWYLNFKSNHPLHVKRGFIQSPHNRASTICQEQQDSVIEISKLRRDLQPNGYPQQFIDFVINSKAAVIQIKRKSLWACNIRTIFRTKHTLRSSLMKTRLERGPQQMAQCVYSILCECGRSYIGKIDF
jgi:hypothetical protein